MDNISEYMLTDNVDVLPVDILDSSCADSPPEAALLPYVMHELAACREFEGLPPGGGLVSK